MGKFENRSGSEDRGRSRSRSDKKPAGKTSGAEEKKGYKAKRSFTKNKSFRGTDEVKKPYESRGTFKGAEDRKSERKPFDKDKSTGYGDRVKKAYPESGEKKSFGKKDGFDKKSDYSERPKRESREREDKPFKKDFGKDEFYKNKSSNRTWDAPKRDTENSDRPERSSDRKDKKPTGRDFKPKADKFDNFKRASEGNQIRGKKESSRPVEKKRRFTKPRKEGEEAPAKRFKHGEFEEGKAFAPQTSKAGTSEKRIKKSAPVAKQTGADGLIRLNKYLSNAGIASRRDADNLIISGTVKVNGVVVDQLGTKISPTDKVTYGDSAVRTERKVYLLLNKPKDYITTVDDPKERKTVMELVSGACRERIYPVGRLDRNTTGLLLFTNDGEMTTKLTHPKFGVKKIYHVSLNKGLKPEDFTAITEGVELEDGVVKADDLAFVGEGKKEVGIEIHSGRNRIVRRIFEHLGYDVLKLDRVVFAGLTKKDLPRGKHRFLTGKEISFLQMIG